MRMAAADLRTTIGGVTLSSPIILGSFDALAHAEILGRCFEICGDSLGAVVTKSTTVEPREGYPEPKVARFGDGLLVASGNTNPGIRAMAAVVAAFKEHHRNRVVFGSIVNDPDNPGPDLAEEFRGLSLEYAKAGADGIELNLSCPHLDPTEKELTIVPAQDSAVVGKLVRAVRAGLDDGGYRDCLVIPKLTGWCCNPAETALAAEKAGADAVTISNLFPGTGYHSGVGEGGPIGGYLVAHGKGGYSGRAMHAAVLLMIETLRRHLSIPVIGTGGCASDLDALVQTFLAGAVAVESVTPFYFRNAGELGNLEALNGRVAQLQEFMAERGLRHTRDLHRIGSGRGRT
jgi:dihydroorotate dehydrogenase (NAD+) catalytic subunit